MIVQKLLLFFLSFKTFFSDIEDEAEIRRREKRFEENQRRKGTRQIGLSSTHDEHEFEIG